MPYFFLITVLSNDLQNFQIFYIYHSSQQIFLVFQDVFKTSWRRLQHNTFSSSKTSWRRLQDVFAIRLPKASSRRLQDVFARRLQDLFKTFSKRACKTILQDDFKKTSCNYVSKTSSRCLQDVLQDKKMLHWRRLQDVFKTSSVRIHQDECLLG